MGGKAQQTKEINSTTQPWLEAQPQLKNILGGLSSVDWNLTGNENEALNRTVALARAGNPYAPAIDSFATTALAGGGPDRSGLLTDAYNRYKTDLEGTARGDYLDPNKNPFFGAVTGAIGNDVQNRLSAMYAGAGRSPAGAGSFGQNLGRGIAEGTAPVFASAWQKARDDQLNAQNNLFGAGQSTTGILSGLDQQRLGNQAMGVDAATAATNARLDPFNRMLAAEAQRRGIPLGTLGAMTGIATPIAGLGSQTQGRETTTQPRGLFDWIQMLGRTFGGGGGGRGGGQQDYGGSSYGY